MTFRVLRNHMPAGAALFDCKLNLSGESMAYTLRSAMRSSGRLRRSQLPDGSSGSIHIVCNHRQRTMRKGKFGDCLFRQLNQGNKAGQFCESAKSLLRHFCGEMPALKKSQSSFLRSTRNRFLCGLFASKSRGPAAESCRYSGFLKVLG
jgi:hypothetical protein